MDSLVTKNRFKYDTYFPSIFAKSSWHQTTYIFSAKIFIHLYSTQSENKESNTFFLLTNMNLFHFTTIKTIRSSMYIGRGGRHFSTLFHSIFAFMGATHARKSFLQIVMEMLFALSDGGWIGDLFGWILNLAGSLSSEW